MNQRPQACPTERVLQDYLDSTLTPAQEQFVADHAEDCPDCDEKIVFNPHPKVGQKLVCPHCDAELEVLSVKPLELDWAYDWDDEGKWDDEYD